MKMRLLLVRESSINIAITDYVMARHALPHSKVVYYGVEVPGPAAVRTESATACPRKPAFAFVGRFVPEKGIPVLLRAASRIAAEGFDFELRLIGDGPVRADVEREIDRTGLRSRVRMLGFLGGTKQREALEDVLAVVMPSVWEEAAGLAAIEQMVYGRLVIASAIGGLQEIVGDSGITFPAGDDGALADKMRSVLRNPALAREYGTRARARSLQLFTRQRMIEDHAKVYRRLAGHDLKGSRE